MKFNINNYVKIKLTKRGREIIEHRRKEYELLYNIDTGLPIEDGEGWSKWQLWDLMSTFGLAVYNDCEEPFELEIEIIEK